MVAACNVTVNIFKHSYVLPVRHLSSIQCIFKPRYYVAGQVKSDRKFLTVRTHTCKQDEILFKKEFAT